VLVAALHDSDLTKESLFELSRNLQHYIQRKPMWQLHLGEHFMITTNIEIFGITSQDIEELPVDWTAGVRHGDFAVI